MGINGAFLTGDLFNLFVFFEILLIASYSLTHSTGRRIRKPGQISIMSRSTCSARPFSVCAGYPVWRGHPQYGGHGRETGQLSGDKLYLAKAGGLLLIVVFGLKAALVPLQFWLVSTYTTALAPVAALFAIMTKVGVYSFIRVHVQIFGGGADGLQDSPMTGCGRCLS